MPNKRDSCCVPGCDSSSLLHKFPHPVRDCERFRRWVMAVGGEVVGLGNEYIYQNRRVCQNHFSEYYKCRNNRISNIAVPTLNLAKFRGLMPGSVALKRTLQEIQNFMPEPSVSTLQENQSYKPGPSTSKENFTMSSRESGPKTTVQDIFLHLPRSVLGPSTSMLKGNQTLTSDLTSHTTEISKGQVRKKGRYLKISKNEKVLINRIRMLKIKLSKCKSQTKKQKKSLTMARNLMTNSNFLKILDNLTTTGKILTLLQFREHKKKNKGRRFCTKEKILALAIFKQSPKAYRFLRQILILPAPQTLVKLVRKAVVMPGINKQVFDQLKTKTIKMKTTEKLCVLLFDEVSIQANLTYNERQDAIIGFATDGKKTAKTFANHATVFMIRGLLKNYKQPVAYMFCTGATKAEELKRYIREIINELHNAGFIVLATVCDQGTNNQKAIKGLVEDTRRDMVQKNKELKKNAFTVDGHEILTFFDPPHLLKGIRNNLLVKNLSYELEGKVCIAKWSHIEMLYKENPAYKGIRLMPKLTENHVIPKKIGKMRVKFASQIFSETVSSNMGYLAEKKILPEECKETADLLLLFDKLFDSMNGSYNKKGKYGKPLLQCLKVNSGHHLFWQKAKKCLKTMKFINQKGKAERVPTLDNWLWTIESMEDLIKKLNDEFNINSLWTRHLNQDPVENFFGAIRSQGFRNVNPSSSAFQSAFTSLIINNLTSIHATGSNCEDDLCQSLQAYIVNQSSTVSQKVHDINIEHLNADIVPLEQKKKDPKIMAPLSYVTGYILRQCKKYIFKNCKNCKAVLCDTENTCEYIKHREFAGRGWLCYPNTQMLSVISDMQELFYFVMIDHFNKCYIKEYLKTVILITVDFQFIACSDHRCRLVDFLINTTLRFFLYNYCKDVNKILMGKRKVENANDYVQKAAQEHYDKSLKKKKTI